MTNSDQAQPYLSWISNDDLETVVTEIYTSFAGSVLTRETLKGLQQNIIDPFAFMLSATLSHQDIGDWLQDELVRQTQKTLGNAIGKFHQRLLGLCNGWKDLGTKDTSGLDLMGQTTIGISYAEIKNKYNTMNTSSRKTVFNKLKRAIDEYGADQAFLVEILPRGGKAYHQTWEYKETKYSQANTDKRIQIISGDKFYALVTGHNNALEQLFFILPTVLSNIINSKDVPRKIIKIDGEKIKQELQSQIQKNNLTYDESFIAAYNYFYSISFTGVLELDGIQDTIQDDSSE